MTQILNAHIPEPLKSEIKFPSNNALSSQLLIPRFALKSPRLHFAKSMPIQRTLPHQSEAWRNPTSEHHSRIAKFPRRGCSHTCKTAALAAHCVCCERLANFITSVPKLLCPQTQMLCWVRTLIKYPSWRCENAISL